MRRARAPAPRRPGAADRTPRRRTASAPPPPAAGGTGRAPRPSIGFRPWVVSAARLSAAIGLGVAVDGGDAGALGEPQRERPDAAEQVGDGLRACRTCSSTSRASAASPAAVACRNAPGGSVDPRAAHRARSARRAARPSRRGGSAAPAGACRRRAPAPPSRAGVSGPEPRTSTSRPPSVAVDLDVERLAHAARAPRRSPRRPASAPSSAGASTGQRSIATM